MKGQADELLQHLKMTDVKYEAAFELLKTRFENKRLMFTYLFDKILDQPILDSDSALSIRQMLDTTKIERGSPESNESYNNISRAIGGKDHIKYRC